LIAVGFSEATMRAQFGDVAFVRKPLSDGALLELVRGARLSTR